MQPIGKLANNLGKLGSHINELPVYFSILDSQAANSKICAARLRIARRVIVAEPRTDPLLPRFFVSQMPDDDIADSEAFMPEHDTLLLRFSPRLETGDHFADFTVIVPIAKLESPGDFRAGSF